MKPKFPSFLSSLNNRRLEVLSKTLTLSIAIGGISTQSTHAATLTWGGTGSTTTTNDLGLATNWSGGTLPDETLLVQPGDTALFNGSRAGAQTLDIASDTLDTSGNGNDLYLSSGQTSSVSIDTTSTSRGLRVDNITLESGTGALNIGTSTSATSFPLTLGGGATGGNTDYTHNWTNNSGNIVTFGTKVAAGIGGTAGTHTVTFGGSGDWAWNGTFTAATTGITKAGTGTLTIGGAANSYTGTTRAEGGTLKLDFSTAAAPTTNLISSSSALQMAGGTLNVTGKASTANTQTFASLTLGAGSSKIDYVPGASGGTTGVTIMAAVTPAAAAHGTLQFGTGGTSTLSGNLSAAILLNGENNAYATYGTDDWAATSAGGVVQAASYTDISSGGFASGVNYNVIGSFSTNSVGASPNTFRYADATGQTITWNTNTLTLRGILVASTAGASALNGSGFVRNTRSVSGNNFDFNIIQNSSNDFTIGANLSNASSSTTTVVKSGAGRLILTNAANGYGGAGGGGTVVNGGVLSISSNGNLGNVNTGVTLNGGSLEVTSHVALDDGSTNRNVTLGAGGGGLYAGSGATMTVNGVVSGSGNLNINGSYSANGGTITDNGTVVLTNANTYTGATTVNAGTLNISSGGSLASGSAVTVQNTGSTLSGAGTVNGNVNIKNGAILAAGDSGGAAVGKITASTGANALTLESGSIFSWDLATSKDTGDGGTRGTDYDAVDAANVSANANAIFRVVLGAIPLADMADSGDTFWKQTQTWDNIFNSVFTGFNPVVQVYSGGSDISGTTNVYGSFTASGSTLTWSAVPEPTSALAGLLLGAGLLRRRRA